MELMSSEISNISVAMRKMQEELGPAVKGKKNPFFKSSYADLSACIEAIREPFSNNDLCFFQGSLPGKEGSIVIVTTISHKSGEWVRGYLEVKPTKADPQALGSAITYGKRYGLQALSGLPTEDDDGNAASGKRDNFKKQAKPKDAPKFSQAKVNIIKELADSKIKTDDGLFNFLNWAGPCDKYEQINPARYDEVIRALEKRKADE